MMRTVTSSIIVNVILIKEVEEKEKTTATFIWASLYDMMGALLNRETK